MSRSGLFRAAALLAASAAPLLAGSANAAEVPQLNSGLPGVGADQLLNGATPLGNPLDAADTLQLPTVVAPVLGDVQAPALPSTAGAQERKVPHPNLGAIAGLPDPQSLPGTANVDNLRPKPPVLSNVAGGNVVPNPHVITGMLPTING
ncbi:hypothetical protein SAMN05216188_12031 [Lentzea xinjiangensis]|uniref:GLTT repeat-containing protein n=1 Tax=Lentzea xinjiangensis TaxID=402600 RepID=A0A1H9U2X6_9PSEU|nr:hypothetical protein [Lentzea xinjiangensis]SES03662.1 hypothetical protein SAMN05216188_12031 [Lentzea xinjiangensis]